MFKEEEPSNLNAYIERNVYGYAASATAGHFIDCNDTQLG